MSFDQLLAAVVGVLAALAVIGALALVIVAELVAIRRKLADYRRSPQDAAESFWKGRGTTVPTISSRRKW